MTMTFHHSGESLLRVVSRWSWLGNPTFLRAGAGAPSKRRTVLKEPKKPMGQTVRTTKLSLDLGNRKAGGANQEKRRALEETMQILDAARRFYLAFFLAYPDKFQERVQADQIRRPPTLLPNFIKEIKE